MTDPFPWLHRDPSAPSREELRMLNRIDERRRTPRLQPRGYNGPCVAVFELKEDGAMKLVGMRADEEAQS